MRGISHSYSYFVACITCCSVCLETQGQGALAQAVDFQGECGDLMKMQMSIIECQLSVQLEQEGRKFF